MTRRNRPLYPISATFPRQSVRNQDSYSVRVFCMDETTREIIKSITIRSDAEQQLPGGHKGCIFYNCAYLTPSQLSRLAATAMWEDEHIDFDVVVGLAYRGIFFASAIAAGKPAAILQADGGIYGPSIDGKRVILVDDVIVNGSTISQSKKQLESMGAKVVALACIIDRSNGLGARQLGAPLISAFRTVLE